MNINTRPTDTASLSDGGSVTDPGEAVRDRVAAGHPRISRRGCRVGANSRHRGRGPVRYLPRTFAPPACWRKVGAASNSLRVETAV